MKHDMTPIMIKTQGHRSSVESRLQSGSNTYTKHPARLRCALRRVVAAVALVLGITLPVTAQTANYTYVFYNASNGYLVNNGGSPGVSYTFNKNAIWVANNTMGNNSRNVKSYTDNTKYFTGSNGSNWGNGSFSLGTSENQWQIRSNYLNRANNNRGYVRYNGTQFIVNQSNTDQNFTGLAITINSSTPSNPTISISASNGLTNGGIQLTGNISGTYTPTYYYASVRNYNNNNTQTYYWTETTDATTTQPTGITNWNDATKTWAVTTGGAYASVSSEGLVTITGNPTGNIVVTLTVTKGGYEGTQTITLTRTAVAENVSGPTYSPITVTPSSVTLENEGDQETLVVSNSVTKTITTTPAHIKFTASGNDYYYYNNSLNATTPTPSISNTTLDFYSVNWVASGGDSYLYTLTPGSYSTTSNELTLTRTANKSDSDQSYTMNVTAGYGEWGSVSLTTTATIYIPKTLVDIGDLLCDNLTLTYGESGALNAHASYVIGGTGAPYYDLTFTVADPTIASVDANGVVTALKVGTTTVTIQSKKMNGDPGPSCTVDITVNPAPLAAPSIDIDKDGLVTITDNNDPAVGATIYYTTNGDTPTASSTLYTTTFTAANLSTIKAIAIASSNYNPSAVVSEQFISSGVMGSTIILNDLEDHNWTYYSDKPDSDYPDVLQSPDPRNVKIIYYGNGGEVSYNEAVNEFDYYKTIEKINNNYTYKVIPNPFSKRPTEGTGNTRWRGFGGWKIISGGEYINGHNNNDVLSLEETLTLTGLDAGYTKNCTSATIELQATWVQAYVATQGSGNITSRPASLTGTTYETNFIVITDNTNHTVSGTGRVTISNRYPDGTAGGNGTVNGCTSAADGTKIEFANISGTFTEAAGPLIVGRGCTGTVGEVTGSNANRVKNIRLESGTYSFVHPMQGLGDNAANRGNFVFGCDYDRAQVTTAQPYGDNSKLRIVVFTSLNGGGGHANNNTDDLQNITVKSGYYGFTSDFTSWQANKNDGWGLGIGGNSDNFSDNYVVPDENGVMRTYTYGTKPPHNTMSFYVGPTRGGGKGGKNYLRIEGGELSSINGGGTTTPEDFIRFDFRMTGGWVKGALYGGASATDCSGSSKIVITGGEVNSWIGGGCNGTDIDAGAGATNGTIYIYAGGNAQIRSHNSDGVYNNAWGLVNHIEGGQIFGGGRGMGAAGSYSGSATNSYVVVADDSYVEQYVYGGSCHGVSQYGYVYILGGTVGKKVFGGSFEPTSTNATWQAKDTHVRMYGGLVKEGLYGGNDAEGTVTEDTEVLILGGQVGTDVNNPGYVFGGGYGADTRVSGNVVVTIGHATDTKDLAIYGEVYGGSAMGTVNTNASNTTDVTLNNGSVYGSIYGGGLGDSSNAADVNGVVTVTVNGGSVFENAVAGSGSVFGCNNLNGSPQQTVTVVVNGTDTPSTSGTYAVQNVFAGGNAAPYTGNPTVTVNGGYVGDVYGGGLGSTALLTGNSSVTLNGGTIGRAFGGGSQANVTGNVTVLMANQSPGAVVGELYGGGALANTNTGGTSNTTTVNLFGGTVGYAYGGGLGDLASSGTGHTDVAATVGGPVMVTLAGSKADNVFGCNNVNGTPLNSVKVLVQRTVAREGTHAYHVDNVYGGGNKAEYVPNNPNNPNNFAATVEVEGCDNSIEYVYGGGNAASTPATDVTIWGGIIDYVFAGGNGQGSGNPGANVGYHQDPDINDPLTPGAAYGTGIASAKIYGGEIHNVFGGSNTRGNIRESSVAELDVPDNKKCDTFDVGEVYGAGNKAYMAGSSNIELGCIPGLKVIYGGAKNANIGKDIVLTLTSGMYERVFGGNNLGGDILGSITVNIEETGCNPLIIGELYGCGNNASYTVPAGKADPQVNIRSFTSIGKVFGGGLGSGAVVHGNTNVNINVAKGANADAAASVVAEGYKVYDVIEVPAHQLGAIGSIGEVFGGGNAAAVDGDTNVNIGTKTTVEMESLPLVGGAKQTRTVEGVDIKGNVYGGGNAADVTGKTNVTIGQP